MSSGYACAPGVSPNKYDILLVNLFSQVLNDPASLSCYPAEKVNNVIDLALDILNVKNSKAPELLRKIQVLEI